MIRGLLISTASSVALAATAFAANAQPLASPPVFSWTGLYAGLNAGASFGNFNKTNFYEGAPFAWNSTRASGFSGGGQIGFNYQFRNNLVLGFETDFQGSTLRGNYGDRARSYSYDDGEGDFGSGSSLRTSESDLEWWGTVRGRLGYAVGDILPYITGGFAYGRIHNSSTYSASGSGCYSGCEGSYSYSHFYGHSSSGVVPGWTVGASLEYVLTHNLTFKAEYLFTELESWDHYWNNDQATTQAPSYRFIRFAPA